MTKRTFQLSANVFPNDFELILGDRPASKALLPERQGVHIETQHRVSQEDFSRRNPLQQAHRIGQLMLIPQPKQHVNVIELSLRLNQINLMLQGDPLESIENQISNLPLKGFLALLRTEPNMKPHN